jgi:hypothetical protein
VLGVWSQWRAMRRSGPAATAGAVDCPAGTWRSSCTRSGGCASSASPRSPTFGGPGRDGLATAAGPSRSGARALRTGRAANPPAQVAADLMSGIARTERDGECASQFTEQGRRVFVDAYDQPDCAAALHEVRARISEPDRYRDRVGTASITVNLRPEGLADVDGYRLQWRGRGLEHLTGSGSSWSAPCRSRSRATRARSAPRCGRPKSSGPSSWPTPTCRRRRGSWSPNRPGRRVPRLQAGS